MSAGGSIKAATAGTLFLLGFFGMSATALATERFVSNSPGGVGAPPGVGCEAGEAGYADPQEAIDASGEGDVIVICPGTYPGGYDLDKTAATGDLFFEGTGSESTIIDGKSTTQLFFDSDPGDLARVHFEGMAFMNGLALDDDTGIDGGGGAIGLERGGEGSDVVVTSSQFAGNVAQGSGGAIDGLDVTISDSTFADNRSDLGAGGQQDRGGAVKAAGDLVVTGSTFTLNVGHDQGGAVSAEGGVTVRSSTFAANESGWDGGAIFAPSGLVLTSSIFTENVANDSGGAVWASGLACVDYFGGDCPPAPAGYSGVGTTFASNRTEGNNGNGRGGGLYSESALYMDNAAFVGNSAADSDTGGATPNPDGGGLFNAGEALVRESAFTSNTAVRDGGGIGSSGDLILIDSTVTGNSNSGDGDGGGIWSDVADLTVRESTVSDNSSTSLGGGIQVQAGDLAIENSTISGNEALNVGGGIFVFNAPPASVLDSTLAENEAGNGGGAILADDADLTVNGSTFTNNQSGSGVDWPGGGAIAGNRKTRVTNSTFFDNRAIEEGIEQGVEAGGGAIAALGPLAVINATLSGNSNPGLINYPGTEYEIANSIIDQVGTGCELEGAPRGIAGNVVTVPTTGCDSLVGGPPPSLEDRVAVDALGLSPLVENGGPTETMAIGPGSAAIGAGVRRAGGLCDQPDQRGVPRAGNTCDAGAYEYEFKLRVSRTGSGFGSVKSFPAGIDCGVTCAAAFDPDSEVTLTAAASKGSKFTRWSGGGCSGTGPCTVTVEGLTNVGAVFTGNGPGLGIAPAKRKPIRVRSRGAKVPVAKVSCSRRKCSILSARVVFRVGGKKYRAKPRFRRGSFPSGKKAIVSAVMPRAAYRRFKSSRKKAFAEAVIVARSDRTPSLKRKVKVRLAR